MNGAVPVAVNVVARVVSPVAVTVAGIWLPVQLNDVLAGMLVPVGTEEH